MSRRVVIDYLRLENVTANGSSSIRRAKCDIAEVKHAIQLAARDMTIRGHDDPHGRNRRRAANFLISALWRQSNSAPDRPAKGVPARDRERQLHVDCAL
jgi:hypothetical protein